MGEACQIISFLPRNYTGLSTCATVSPCVFLGKVRNLHKLKNRIINFRVTDEELARLKTASDLHGARCLSEFARAVMLGTASGTEGGRCIEEQLQSLDGRLQSLHGRLVSVESGLSRIDTLLSAEEIYHKPED